MTVLYTYIRLGFLFFSLVFITSCKGQEKTNIPQDPPDSLKEMSNINTSPKTLKKNRSHQDAFLRITIDDPLFFIEGQLCQHLRKIFQDKHGNLWFGTNVYGLMRYNGKILEYFDKKNGFGTGRTTAIVEDKNGNVWFGAHNGLFKYDPLEERRTGSVSFTNFSEEQGLINNDIWSLLIDSKGIFWVGTSRGVSKFDGKQFTTFSLPKAQVKDTTFIYSQDRITAMMEDTNGDVWFGTDGFGITRYDGTDFTFLTEENGLPANTISEIIEDKNENIWIATMLGGISKFDGETHTHFTQNGLVKGIETGALFEDENGDVWFASEHNGVYRYDGKTFTNFNSDNGLLTGGILSIFRDREERFWFGGWGGLFRYDGKSFTPVTWNGPWDK